MRKDDCRLKAGDRVVSRISGATGEIVKINDLNKSSPLVVRWDGIGGFRSNENMNSITKLRKGN
jgi:hypothetical protein